jgi:hypothetical protein
LVLQLGPVGTLAKDRKNDISTNRKVGRDKSGVDKLNRIISCEVQILKGGDKVKGVILFDCIGEVGIREVGASGGVDVVARA